MSRVTIINQGSKPVFVTTYRCCEDGWGKESRTAIDRRTLQPSLGLTLDVAGDTRGGGTRVEITEDQ